MFLKTFYEKEMLQIKITKIGYLKAKDNMINQNFEMFISKHSHYHITENINKGNK